MLNRLEIGAADAPTRSLGEVRTDKWIKPNVPFSLTQFDV